MRRSLAALAGRAPARVFPVTGSGARERVDQLRLDARLCFVDSPRSATILLVAGELPESLMGAARAVHDGMPRPRATLWWTLGSAEPGGSTFPGALVLGAGEDVGGAAQRAQAALLLGDRVSEPDLLPDVDPAPWRGVGPYGQGGKGMTGGVPYGRPLAERAPDRDGLELDQVPVRLGPFFPPFPPGLVLDLRLQGDVIEAASLGDNPFTGPRQPGEGMAGSPNLFALALTQPVPIAELELARARHHLVWLGNALRVHGLGALGRRALRLAARITSARAEDVRALGRVLEGTRSFGWATAGIGVTDAALLAAVAPGPVSRAAAIARDARADDPVYRSLGFEPVVQHDADARARWRQRLAEAIQALELAGRAGMRASAPVGHVETPLGTLTADDSPAAGLLAVVPALVAGTEWGDAVTTIVSLDLDVEETASRRPPAA